MGYGGENSATKQLLRRQRRVWEGANACSGRAQSVASWHPVIAQLVEHLTVESCSDQMVPGSIPGDRISACTTVAMVANALASASVLAVVNAGGEGEGFRLSTYTEM